MCNPGIPVTADSILLNPGFPDSLHIPAAHSYISDFTVEMWTKVCPTLNTKALIWYNTLTIT